MLNRAKREDSQNYFVQTLQVRILINTFLPPSPVGDS